MKAILRNKWLGSHGQLLIVFALYTLVFNPAPAQAAPGKHSLVILVDTSQSMTEKNRLATFKVEMINLVEGSIPVDGTWSIQIFSFDRGLDQSFSRTLAGPQDKKDAQLFLNALQAKGSATWLYQSLDKVLAQVQMAAAQEGLQDIVIHAFTDGDNTGGGLSFKQNVDRFISFRKGRNASTELYYHALEGYTPPRDIQSAINPGEGVFLVYGVKIPPKIRLKPLAFAPNTSTPVQLVAIKVLGAVEKWLWDFGDGNSSAEESPTHKYARPGEYWVTCKAINSAGEGTDRMKLVVGGQAPVADFDFDTDPAIDGSSAGTPTRVVQGAIPVRFTDKSKGATAWLWDFGDKTPGSNEQNPVHGYANPGTYSVTLEVQNAYGKHSITKKITLEPRPVLRFSWSPQTPRENTEVQFVNESIGELVWSWDLGNGKTSQEKNPKTIYVQTGQYVVQLNGVTRRGKVLSCSNRVSIGRVDPPKAKFTLSTSNLMVGEYLICQDISTGAITNRTWNLGDGTKASAPAAQHMYIKPGVMPITLRVEGPGGSDETTASVTIRPVVIKFAVGTTEVQESNKVTFFNKSEAPPLFAYWRWDMGDGVVYYTNRADIEHMFRKPGTFQVQLTASPAPFATGAAAVNKGSAPNLPAAVTSSSSVTVTSHYRKPVIAFGVIVGNRLYTNGSRIPARTGVELQFTNLSTGSIQSQLWDFGDGKSDRQHPKHAFAKSGKYRVKLALTSTRAETVVSTEDHYIDITAGWMPDRAYRWPSALVLFLLGYCGVRFWPWQRREILYQIGVQPRRSFRSWKKDLHMRGSTEGFVEAGKKNPNQPAGAAPQADDSCEFKIVLTRNFWLRKGYLFQRVKGAPQALRPDNRPLVGTTIGPRSSVNFNGARLLLQSLNQKATTGLIPLIGIIILVLWFLKWTWPLFA